MTDKPFHQQAHTAAMYVKMMAGDFRVNFTGKNMTLWDALRSIDNEAKTGRRILGSLSAFFIGGDEAKDVLTAIRVPLYLHAYVEAHEDDQIEQVFTKAEIAGLKGIVKETTAQVQFIVDALSDEGQSDYSQDFDEAYDFEEGEWFYYIVDGGEILPVK